MAILPDVIHEFRRHKAMADRAIAGIDDEALFRRLGRGGQPDRPDRQAHGRQPRVAVDRLPHRRRREAHPQSRRRVRRRRPRHRAALLAKWEAGWASSSRPSTA